MSFEDLEAAFDLINENGGDFEGEKDEALIAKAEKALGLVFPPSYRKFLSKLGCGDIEGLEFFGLIGSDFENSSVPNAIWLTLDERKSGLPDNLILIYAAGDGTYYALDTSQVDSERECQVVSYDVNGKIAPVACDFGAFLLSELQTVLK